jgi:hypothetical protein
MKKEMGMTEEEFIKIIQYALHCNESLKKTTREGNKLIFEMHSCESFEIEIWKHRKWD